MIFKKNTYKNRYVKGGILSSKNTQKAKPIIKKVLIFNQKISKRKSIYGDIIAYILYDYCLPL
jgi:hypothetical protein